MIKLLLAIPTLDQSGAEKQFTLLATRLPRQEFDVSAVTITRGGPYESILAEAGIPVTHLRKRWKFDPFALGRLKRLIRSQCPDVLHTWLFAANAYGRLAIKRSGRPKVVVSERCVDTWKAGWQHTLDNRLEPKTDRLVANSESVAAFYREREFPAAKIRVIRNGIELPELVNFDRAALLAEFDIPAHAKVVGYVGRLAKQKRLLDLVWAMQLLQQLNDKAYFLVVGAGPEQESALKLARHMGCDHLVRFAGHRDDANRLMQAMDVFWLASDFEGQSNSVMEAMAAGVPVVASDIPPNRELVVDGETGFLVKVGDSVGFAQFADRIFADEQLAARLGSAARDRMRTEFSIDSMVNAYAKLYRELVT